MAFVDSFVERVDPPPRHVEMTIVAQDPTVTDADGRILRAKVKVPAGRLEPGPRSARFHVIDYDATTGTLAAQPADLTGPDGRYVDRFADARDKVLLTSADFRAQHVYAVAARTLAIFESALGRRLHWGFPGHQLHIVPQAFDEANAYYSDEDRALLFGYISEGRGRAFTCLSHDVVAHETAHAVLDGLRHRFLEPGLPDQAAFHEALADLVALLSVFSVTEMVEQLLGPADSDGRIRKDVVAPDTLRNESKLFGVAEQMGRLLTQGRGALRQSGTHRPGIEWQTDVAFEEPHLRGEILVAVVIDVFVDFWTARLEKLIHQDGRLDRGRAAEEGAKAAGHLLTMALRAIDYLPPVEFEFVDFVDAALTSDAEVAPDDEYGYRDKVRKAFAAFGVAPGGTGRIIDLSGGGFIPLYHGLNFSAMRTQPDEVYRFIWENARELDISTAYYTHVEAVRPSVRVGPDGLVVNEAVAHYIQMLDVTAEEFTGLVGRDDYVLPDDVAKDTKLQLLGGGTLIFDQFGRAKYHVRKPLPDWERQTRRLDYLARAGFFDTRKRLGFSTGARKGQRFAEFHSPGAKPGEAW